MEGIAAYNVVTGDLRGRHSIIIIIIIIIGIESDP